MLYDDRPYSIQVRQRGQVTIPRRLRESLAIQDGDTLTILPMGDTLVLVPRQLRTPELIDRMADLLEESGLTLNDLLADLPRIREEVYREQYQVKDES